MPVEGRGAAWRAPGRGGSGPLRRRRCPTRGRLPHAPSERGRRPRWAVSHGVGLRQTARYHRRRRPSVAAGRTRAPGLRHGLDTPVSLVRDGSPATSARRAGGLRDLFGSGPAAIVRTSRAAVSVQLRAGAGRLAEEAASSPPQPQRTVEPACVGPASTSSSSQPTGAHAAARSTGRTCSPPGCPVVSGAPHTIRPATPAAPGVGGGATQHLGLGTPEVGGGQSETPLRRVGAAW